MDGSGPPGFMVSVIGGAREGFVAEFASVTSPDVLRMLAGRTSSVEGASTNCCQPGWAGHSRGRVAPPAATATDPIPIHMARAQIIMTGMRQPGRHRERCVEGTPGTVLRARGGIRSLLVPPVAIGIQRSLWRSEETASALPT